MKRCFKPGCDRIVVFRLVQANQPLERFSCIKHLGKAADDLLEYWAQTLFVSKVP